MRDSLPVLGDRPPFQPDSGDQPAAQEVVGGITKLGADQTSGDISLAAFDLSRPEDQLKPQTNPEPTPAGAAEANGRAIGSSVALPGLTRAIPDMRQNGSAIAVRHPEAVAAPTRVSEELGKAATAEAGGTVRAAGEPDEPTREHSDDVRRSAQSEADPPPTQAGHSAGGTRPPDQGELRSRAEDEGDSNDPASKVLLAVYGPGDNSENSEHFANLGHDGRVRLVQELLAVYQRHGTSAAGADKRVYGGSVARAHAGRVAAIMEGIEGGKEAADEPSLPPGVRSAFDRVTSWLHVRAASPGEDDLGIPELLRHSREYLVVEQAVQVAAEPDDEPATEVSNGPTEEPAEDPEVISGRVITLPSGAVVELSPRQLAVWEAHRAGRERVAVSPEQLTDAQYRQWLTTQTLRGRDFGEVSESTASEPAAIDPGVLQTVSRLLADDPEALEYLELFGAQGEGMAAPTEEPASADVTVDPHGEVLPTVREDEAVTVGERDDDDLVSLSPAAAIMRQNVSILEKEVQLIELMRAGDRDAANELLRYHANLIDSGVRRNLPPGEDADDIRQEVARDWLRHLLRHDPERASDRATHFAMRYALRNLWTRRLDATHDKFDTSYQLRDKERIVTDAEVQLHLAGGDESAAQRIGERLGLPEESVDAVQRALVARRGPDYIPLEASELTEIFGYNSWTADGLVQYRALLDTEINAPARVGHEMQDIAPAEPHADSYTAGRNERSLYGDPEREVIREDARRVFAREVAAAVSVLGDTRDQVIALLHMVGNVNQEEIRQKLEEAGYPPITRARVNQLIGALFGPGGVGPADRGVFRHMLRQAAEQRLQDDDL